MNYFAYGSNMLHARLQERVPSANPLGVAILSRHQLAWHKRSMDNSGKCDIVETGVETDRVYGVLYEIDEYEKPDLDQAEGLGKGYDQKCVVVRHGDLDKRAITYFVSNIDPRLKPYQWYKDFVVAGAKENNLPPAYITEIERIEAIQDTDECRRNKNERILKLALKK